MSGEFFLGGRPHGENRRDNEQKKKSRNFESLCVYDSCIIDFNRIYHYSYYWQFDSDVL